VIAWGGGFLGWVGGGVGVLVLVPFLPFPLFLGGFVVSLWGFVGGFWGCWGGFRFFLVGGGGGFVFEGGGGVGLVFFSFLGVVGGGGFWGGGGCADILNFYVSESGRTAVGLSLAFFFFARPPHCLGSSPRISYAFPPGWLFLSNLPATVLQSAFLPLQLR